MLQDYHSPFDATVVELLKAAGRFDEDIDLCGSMDEFGMGSHSQYAHEGPVQSLYSRCGIALSPGGSSGGSAVAVARGACEVALGTDTGGSVRLPAAYTGVLGFKPSYGRISRWGVIQYANSLDTVGILGRQVEKLEETFAILDKHDTRDQTSLSESLRKRIRSQSSRRFERLRIGIPIEYNIKELSPIVKKTYLDTLRLLRKAGHTLHAVSLPSTQSALSAYYVLAPAEASSNLAKYDGIRYGHRTTTSDASPHADRPLPLYAKTRGEGYGEEVKRRILLGAYTLSSEAMDNYFIQAQRVRRLVQQDFNRVFAQQNPLLDAAGDEGGDVNKVDVLLTPTAPTLPPTVDELAKQLPLESYMNDVFTVPASLAGLPAISVPVPVPSAERVTVEDTDIGTAGMQLIGQFGDDEFVLRAAKQLYHELL
ncbi:Glutamyl-tRNA(Gln) amidotransferase subunit A [Cercospora zeina]